MCVHKKGVQRVRGERGKGNRQLLVEICVSAGQVEQKKQRQIETETDRQSESTQHANLIYMLILLTVTRQHPPFPPSATPQWQ